MSTIASSPVPCSQTVLMLVKTGKDGPVVSLPGYVISQANSIRRAGWTVDYGFVESPRSIRQVLTNIRDLKRQADQVRASVIHAQYGSGSALVGARIRGARALVISFCGSDLLGTNVPGFKWRLRDWITKYMGVFAASRASLVVLKSSNLLPALPSALRNKSVIIPNGVDTDVFRPMDKTECRARLQWPLDRQIVLFNANWHAAKYTKNPDLARRSVQHLERGGVPVTLHLMSQASQESVVTMMNAADCLLLTSLHEGSPNVVKEAMACNLPVVSVPCGDVRERLAFTHPMAICGYDVESLANGLRSVLAAGARSNGRVQLIEQGLTIDRVGRRLAGLYSDLSNGGSEPDQSSQANCFSSSNS